MAHQGRYLNSIPKHGRNIKVVHIELDQAVQENRQNACRVITGLSEVSERRLQRLVVRFTGENPYFYAGQEFVDALSKLFGPVPRGATLIHQLKFVDISGLLVNFNDQMFDLLSEHHPALEKLNIQNDTLVCKVSPECMLRLVSRCRRLRELWLFNCSLSEDILLSLMEDDRVPLEHLSVKCRREEKYGNDIPAETWQLLARKLPKLRVTLGFDHTCPLYRVSQIMLPEIPVHVLRLETHTTIYDEINSATHFYRNTLEKVVLQTRSCRELDDALLNLSANCQRLRSIHVFCVLQKNTVEAILIQHPEIKENATYTLKYTADPHPWIAGHDC